MGAAIPKVQPGGAVPVGGGDRVVYGGEGFRGADQVVAESLDAEQASVGGEADLPQRGRVGQPFPDTEVAGVVIVVSVRSALPSLWYCLIAVYL